MIKLCYKSYPYKMTLGSMRHFNKQTGKDLWSLMMDFMLTFLATSEDPVMERMAKLYRICDFETASIAIHSLVRVENKNIPIEEIQDAMFRVGWMPVQDDESEMIEPWPLDMCATAFNIDSQMREEMPKKK